MRRGLFVAFAVAMLVIFAVPAQVEAVDTAPVSDKTEVFISVTDTIVAHTAMDNPVKYTLMPESAAESARVTVSYRAIKFLADTGVEVAVPKDIGKYLVYIEAEFDDPSLYCAGKYLIYEIAEKQGAPLSEEDALKSVPDEFNATVESISATYSVSYKQPSFSLNVSGVKARLMYSHLYANGTTGEYTEQLPTEPGDYIASCFVLDTVVGTGRLIIDKLSPEIIMDDASFTYTPSGIYPAEAVVSPAGIELEYKAYIYENGLVGESVDLPLVNCGTYLISACPADTSHYSFTLSYCYITINKVTPIISAESLVYTANGKPKALQYTVTPDFVECNVCYYRLENGVSIPIEAPPVEIGEYYAVVSIKATSTASSTTRVFGIRIINAESGMQRFFRISLKVLCIATALSALGFGGAQIYTAIRRKGENKR